MEQELGVELFDRSRKQLTLTDAGQIIFEQAKLIDLAFKNLGTELTNLLELKKGHIRIGLPPLFDARFLLEIVGSFHEIYPGITFQLIEQGSKKIEEAVENNSLDVGIVVLPTNLELFHHFSLIEDELRLIVQNTHPLAAKTEVHLNELENESFILFNKDFVLNDRIIYSCNSVGFQPKVVSESTQQSFIAEMVACNLGIALLPESVCHHLNENITTIKVVNPVINSNLAIIWSKDQYLSYAAKEWIHYIKEQYTENKNKPQLFD